MKHLKQITSPAAAQSADPTPGQILSLVASILTVLATALSAKENAGG